MRGAARSGYFWLSAVLAAAVGLLLVALPIGGKARTSLGSPSLCSAG